MLAPRMRLFCRLCCILPLLVGLAACSGNKSDHGGADSGGQWPVGEQRQWVTGSVLDTNAVPIAGADVRLGELTAVALQAP